MNTEIHGVLSVRYSIVATVIGLATLAAILAVVGHQSSRPSRPTTSDHKEITSCIEQYATRIQPQSMDWQVLSSASGFCSYVIQARFAAEEQTIIDDNFVFQRYENQILMFLVIAITISGVVLAALQLLASYRLASAGRGSLAEGGEVSLKRDSVVVNSSVVGVVILAVSFAFFLVFILYVYTIPDRTKQEAQVSSAAWVNRGFQRVDVSTSAANQGWSQPPREAQSPASQREGAK